MDVRILHVLGLCLILAVCVCMSEELRCNGIMFEGGGVNFSTSCFDQFHECTTDSLTSVHSELYDKSKWKKPRVDDLMVTSFCRVNAKGDNQSVLNVQWKIQNVEGADKIQGFEVRVNGGLRDFSCTVLSFNENVTRHTIESQSPFNGTIIVSKERDFRISVVSLPKTKGSYIETKDVRSKHCVKGIPTAEWLTNWKNHTYDSNKHELNVSYEAPPKDHNITQFELTLISAPGQQRLYSNKTITNLTYHVFSDVEPGKYLVYLTPYNPYNYDNKRCVCRIDERCQHCKQSENRIEVMKPAPTSSERPNRSLILIIVVTVVVVVIAFIVCASVIAYRRGFIARWRSCDKHNLICIDASKNSDMIKRFERLICKEFKTCLRSTINYRYLPYTANVYNKFGDLIKEMGNRAERNHMNRNYEPVNIGNPTRVVVCLLVHDKADNHVTDMKQRLCETAEQQGINCEVLILYSVCSRDVNALDYSFINLQNEENVVSSIRNVFEKAYTLCKVNNQTNVNGPHNDNVDSVNNKPPVNDRLNPASNPTQVKLPNNDRLNHASYPTKVKLPNISCNGPNHDFRCIANKTQGNGDLSVHFERNTPRCVDFHSPGYLEFDTQDNSSSIHQPECGQRRRYMSEDSGYVASPKDSSVSFTDMYEGVSYIRSGQQLRPIEEEYDKDTFPWIPPEESGDEEVGEDSDMTEYLAKQLWAINEESRTVYHGKA